MDAAAEEALLGEFFGEDDLRGNKDGGLAGLVRDGDFEDACGGWREAWRVFRRWDPTG